MWCSDRKRVGKKKIKLVKKQKEVKIRAKTINMKWYHELI